MTDLAAAAEREFDILRTAPAPRSGLPVMSVMRDEIAHVARWLDHYRALGAGRFAVLDDGSRDGTREVLLSAPDVTLVTSPFRFGDPVGAGDSPFGTVRGNARRGNLWRSLLMARFVGEGWAVSADADEFLHLPPAMDLSGLAARLEADGAAFAWGGLIDLYPAEAGAILRPGDATPPLFFDGVRQFSPGRGGAMPLRRHIGTRRRLSVAAGLHPPEPLWRRLRLQLLGARRAPSGTLVKQPVLRWRPGAEFRTAHVSTLAPGHPRILLPIAHHYYHPGVGAKLGRVLESGGYANANAAYAAMREVLTALDSAGRPMRDARSRPYDGWAGFAATGNTAGFD